MSAIPTWVVVTLSAGTIATLVLSWWWDRYSYRRMEEAERFYEEATDLIDGLEADLDSAIEVAWMRGATEWVRLNYPDHFRRFMSASPEESAHG